MHGAISLTKKSITERALATVSNPMVPASFPLGRGWFVACVMGQQAHKAVKEIGELGLPVFYPTQTVQKVVRGRKTFSNVPIFSGYMFVSFDRERDNWGAILEVNGVIAILQNLNIPVRVPDLIIERLKNMVAAGVFEKASALAVGDRVEITEGPFAGLFAKVKSASPRKRAKVLLEELRAVPVDIDTYALRKA